MRAWPDIGSGAEKDGFQRRVCRSWHRDLPWRALRPVLVPLTFLLAVIVFNLLIEAIVFHSHFYARYLDLSFSTGYTEAVFNIERRRPPNKKKQTLVVGDSRMDQGFSAKIANQHVSGDYFFANLGIDGTNARSWYYLVRDVDPRRDRYTAIAIGLANYDEPDGDKDPADRVSDLPYVANRLRLADIAPFTLSFTTWKLPHQRFFASCSLSPAFIRGDLQDFIERPRRRLQDAAYLRK